MKPRIAALSALCLLALLLAGCAEKYDHADQLRRDGNYAEAIKEYSELLSTATTDREIAGTRFMRGICYQETGQYSEAYVDMYMARAMACWIDANQKQLTPNRAAVGSLAMNEACEAAGPRRLKDIESKMSSAEIATAREKAMDLLPAKFTQ